MGWLIFIEKPWKNLPYWISTSVKFNIYAPWEIKNKLFALMINLFFNTEKTFLGIFDDMKSVIWQISDELINVSSYIRDMT